MTGAFDRIESLLERLQSSATDEQREQVRQILSAVLELHRAGVARMVELSGPELAEAFAADPSVAPLLLLHDCHPHDARRRIGDALDGQRERLVRAGVSVVGLAIQGSRALVQLAAQPSAGGREALVELILAAAPEIDGVELLPAEALIPATRLTRPANTEST